VQTYRKSVSSRIKSDSEKQQQALNYNFTKHTQREQNIGT